jgi:intein/homing endonuclease
VFTKDEFVISTNSDILPQDYIRKEYKPEQINKRRYLHFDQSLSGDSYGIACTYVDDVIVGNDGIPLLFLKVEWIVRINPPKPPAKIDLAKCRSIIPYLAKTYGITFGMISYDTFQSAEAMQELEKSGYPVKTRSVEEDTAYLTLCQYIYDGRIEFPRHPVFEQELFGLMHYRSRHKVDHLPGGCFSKDTKISLLDGRNLSIEELLKEQEEGKVNWVYTINEITKNIEPKPIKRIFKTKTTNDLVKVTLDSGESFICTSDHRLMTRDFNWKEAKDLVYNESMLPLYTKYPGEGNLINYRMFYNPIEDKWHFEHRSFVNEFTELAKNSSYVVHHKNFNKQDNTPTNLLAMTSSEHTFLHNNLTKDYTKVSNSVKNYWKSVDRDSDKYKDRNLKISSIMKKRFKINRAKKEEARQRRIDKIEKYFNIEWNKLSSADKISYSIKYTYISNPYLRETQRQHSRNNYLSKKDSFNAKGRLWYNNGINSLYLKLDDEIPKGYVRGRLITDKMKYANHNRKNIKLSSERIAQMSVESSSRKWYNDGEREYFLREEQVLSHYKRGRINHKVISVERVNDTLDVYDLEIQDNHNFALAAGIFAHNSKDTRRCCSWVCNECYRRP